jgi:hypothetical protein
MANAFQPDAFQHDAFQIAEPVEAVGTWSQSASWAATASEQVESAATWSQDATWDAEGSQASAGTITGVGAWVQSATWTATVATPDLNPPSEARPGRTVRRRFYATATFEQSASWSAVMNTKSPRRDEIEELLLVGAI